jgi:hypothetical protein
MDILISPHPNMRTEFAWMNALHANHIHISNYNEVSNYDHVFIIFPKGQLNLNAEASKLIGISKSTFRY